MPNQTNVIVTPVKSLNAVNTLAEQQERDRLQDRPNGSIKLGLAVFTCLCSLSFNVIELIYQFLQFNTVSRSVYFYRHLQWTLMFFGTSVPVLLMIVLVLGVLMALLTMYFHMRESSVGNEFASSVFTVMYRLFLVFVIVSAAVQLCRYYRGFPTVEVQTAVSNRMRHDILVAKRMGRGVERRRWDQTQRDFACCGVSEYQDWLATENGQIIDGRLPASCCKMCKRSSTKIASASVIGAKFDTAQDNSTEDFVLHVHREQVEQPAVCFPKDVFKPNVGCSAKIIRVINDAAVHILVVYGIALGFNILLLFFATWKNRVDLVQVGAPERKI